MRRSKEEAMETRRAILRVALDSFSKRGYALTTFNDIARRIHLTKGAIFWHFKSKEDLLAALILHMQESYDPLKALEQAETLEAIKETFLAWADVLATNSLHRQFMQFVMSRVEWSEALTAKLRKKLDNLVVSDPGERLVVCLDRLKASGAVVSPLTSEQLASLLCACFFGVHRAIYLHKKHVICARRWKRGWSLSLKE